MHFLLLRGLNKMQVLLSRNRLLLIYMPINIMRESDSCRVWAEIPPKGSRKINARICRNKRKRYIGNYICVRIITINCCSSAAADHIRLGGGILHGTPCSKNHYQQHHDDGQRALFIWWITPQYFNSICDDTRRKDDKHHPDVAHCALWNGAAHNRLIQPTHCYQ